MRPPWGSDASRLVAVDVMPRRASPVVEVSACRFQAVPARATGHETVRSSPVHVPRSGCSHRHTRARLVFASGSRNRSNCSSAVRSAVASSKPGPFQEFYTALVAKGMRPEMARLTLARKIATIVLVVWKKGVCFDASHLKPQTA